MDKRILEQLAKLRLRIEAHIKKLWAWDSRQLGISRILYTSVISVLGLAIPIFVIALLFAHAGEIAGALGSFLGGIVGAGGAVLAVYLALSRQREDEIAKVGESVRVEVITLTKYVIGAVEVCQQIVKGLVKVPRTEANYIAKNFWFDPVVYPAVADRVGLLPHPQATIEFYMRLGEAKAILEVLRTKAPQPSATHVTAPMEYVTPENAAAVADSLITALQLALPIIANTRDTSTRAQLDAMVAQITQQQINDCLTSAKISFPNAESFKAPNTAQ